MTYDSEKTNYIYITNNFKNDSNIISRGVKINIKGFIPSEIENNKYKIFDNYSEEKIKNKIILSGKILNSQKSVILLTQENINHNIKFIYKSNNTNRLFNEPRIIFKKKTSEKYEFNNRFLFSTSIANQIDLQSVQIYNNTLDINNEDTVINAANVSSQNYIAKKLYIQFNVYKSFMNSDFYKININDFLNQRYINNNNNLSYTLKNINLINDILSNNRRINIDNINYGLNNLYYLDNNLGNEQIENDTIINKLNINERLKIINKYFLILYNILNNLTSIRFNFTVRDLRKTEFDYIATNNFNDLNIHFFINRIKFSKKEYTNKIIINKNLLYINSKILDSSSNFFTNNNINTDNKLFLSCGYGIFPITRLNLYKNLKFKNNNIIVSKENQLFLSTINYNYINNNYLLENSIYNKKYYDYFYYFNYTYISLNNKVFDYSFYNLYKYTNLLNSINNYNKVINNYLIYNNIDIYPSCTILSYNNLENCKNNNFNALNNYYHNYKNIDIKISNNSYSINYDIENFSLKFNNNQIRNYRNINLLSYNDNIEFNIDFKNNYSKNIFAYFELDLLYSNIILNQLPINLSFKLTTIDSSNFKDVECIFIYNNPFLNNSDPSFSYPYNNIQVINNPDFDTINKAIELLPIESYRNVNNKNNRNITIIPKKNNSNLSKKQIQGLIGFNNIPKLLSIEPYDPSFIETRGFLNQYRIEDNCENDVDKIKKKINSQKHISVKSDYKLNNTKNKRNNFSNLVKSSIRSRNISSDCTNELNNPNTITKYYTPFKFYK